MEILQTKGIFDKNQKLLDFINKLVIKNEFFANSYESEEASLLYQKISALRAGTYNLSPDERVSFINYLEDMKTNHFSDIEYFLADSNVQYSDLIFSIPPGSESDNGTFLYFVEKGLVYQKELLKKSTYTNILMTGKTYFYYYDENGKIVRVRTEYSKQKDFENKDVFILGKSPNSYSHISNNDIEAGNFIKEYETPLIRVGLNDYPYYFSRLFRHDETSGRLEVFDGYLDDNETLRTQGILTELYGVPKFPYFSIKIKDANSFRVLIEGSIVRWVRDLRDDYPFKTLQEFKTAVSEEYQYSGYPFKNFLVFLGDREYVLSIEYIYENFYKPVSDEDILITDSEGDLIEDEDNGVYANFLTHPHLSLFNTVHGVVEYFPIDKEEINPALSDDLYIRITLKDGTYLEEPNTYKNGTEATIFSLYNFYSFLSQYFFNIPTMSIDNKDGVPDLYADISHMSLQIEVSGEAYIPKILYAYLKTNSLSYSFIIYCKNSVDNSWKKITVPEDKVTFNSQDHVYNLILDNIDLLFVMNESYYGYVLNKVEYIDKEVLLVNTLVKRSNTLEYHISGDEIAETLTNISDPIRFMTIKEDPILGSMEDEIEWLTVEDRKYKFELCRVYRDGREDETELLYNSSESENVNLFELEISGHTVSNYSEGTPKDLLLLPSSLIYPIDPILFPFESNNYYINYRKSGVNIISARVSSDYSILFYPKSILNKEQVNEFMKAYYVSLDYFMRVFYNKSYELYDNYQGVVTILILFSTLQRFLNEDSKFNQNYDLLSKEEVELLFSSYGIRNIRNIPKEYLIKLLFNINNLISKKGTDGVFNEIFNIFDIEDINISRYLLTKNLRKHRTKNYYYIDDIQSYGSLIERRIKEPENKGILGNVLSATDFIDTLIGILERRSYDYKTKELVYLKENIFDAMVSRIYGAEVYNPENNETVLVESIYTDYTELIDLFNTIFQYNENSKILFNERMLPNTINLATDTYKYNLTNYLGELPLLLVYREYEKLSLDYLLFVREFYSNLYLSEKKKELENIPTSDVEEINSENSVDRIIENYEHNSLSFDYKEFSKYLLGSILVEYNNKFVNTEKNYEDFYILFKEEGYPIGKLLMLKGEVPTEDYNILRNLFMKFTLRKYSLHNIKRRELLTEAEYLEEDVFVSLKEDANSPDKLIKVGIVIPPIKPGRSFSPSIIDDRTSILEPNNDGTIVIKGRVHVPGEETSDIDYGQSDGEGTESGGGYPPPTIHTLTPSQVRVGNITKRSARLTWTIYELAVSYVIEISRDNFATVLQTIETTSFITITDLLPGTEYKVKHRLKNAAGEVGPPSSIKTFVTLAKTDTNDVEETEETEEDTGYDDSEDSTVDSLIDSFSDEIQDNLASINSNIETANNEAADSIEELDTFIAGQKSIIKVLVDENVEFFTGLTQSLRTELDEALVIKKKEAEEERKALDELEEWKSYFNETMSVLDIINEEYKLALCDRMIGSLMALYSKSLRKLSIRQVKTLVSTVTTYDLQEREKSFLISTLVNLRLERLKDTEISEIVSAYNVIMAPYAKSEDINRVILDDLKIKLLDQIERVIYEGSFENLLMGITSTYEPDMLATLMEAENLYDKCWFVITDVLKREISEDEIIDNLINHVMMSNPTDDMTYSLRFLRVPINSEKSIEKIVSETPSSEYETFIDFTESDPSWRASQKEIMDRLSLNGFNYLTTKYYSLDHDIYGMKSSDEFIRLFSFLNGHTKYCLDETLANILKVNMTDISTEPISILDVLVGLQYIIFKIHGMSSVTIPNSEEDYKYPTLHLGSEDVTVNLAALCNMSGNAEYLQNTISNFDSVVSGFETAQTLYSEIQTADTYEAARDILISRVKEMEFSEEAMNTLLINVKEYDEYKDKLKKYRDMFLSGTVSDVFSTLSEYSTYDEYCLTELPDFISWLEEGKPEDIEHDTDYYKQKFITFYNYLIDAIEDKEFSRRFKNSFYYDTIKQILTQILRYFQSYTITMQDIITYLRIDQPLQNNTKLTDEMIRSTDLSISERLTVNNLSFTTRLPKFKQYTHSLTLDDGVALEIRLDDETVPPISILDKSRIPLNRYKINKWK